MPEKFCLDDIEIASPCTAAWEEMKGNAKTRFCGTCQKHVYNLSAMTRVEAVRTIAATEGKLCARLYRRADGTVLTEDCPVGLRQVAAQLRETAEALQPGPKRWIWAALAAGAMALAVVVEAAPLHRAMYGEPSMGGMAPLTFEGPARSHRRVVVFDSYGPDAESAPSAQR